MKIKKLFLLFSFILIIYLVLNTGIISDEFYIMSILKGKNIKDVPIPKGLLFFLDTPVGNFTHYIWYYFFRLDNLAIVNILKVSYAILSFYLISQFFKLYLDKNTAIWASFLFLFFPSHDSTVYSFMTYYLTLSFAFYLYSFYLAYNNKLILAFALALVASFLSYGSSPVAVALFILFALNKEFKKSAVMLIPNIVYALYFIHLNIVMRLGSPRIIEKVSIGIIVKQFILQILTFIDAMFGPSMWLKVYYSFLQLSVLSFILGVIFTIIFYKFLQENKEKYNHRLIISFFVLLVLSFAMFAVTGRYPQLAFNLGNRTTIFGSLLLTYLIILLPVSKSIRTVVFTIFIFAILGISDHWKNWNLHQFQVITNIKNNNSLNNYSDNKVIYVSGNQYSKYGPISHIEFFSEDWTPRSVFSLVLNKNIIAKSLNKRHKYINGYLIDTKYNFKTKIDDNIYVYDSEKNILLRLEIGKINSYIESLPADNRHWIQLIDNKFIKEVIKKLMPRLEYAL